MMSVYMKKYASELSVFITVAAALLILFFLADYFFGVVDFVGEFFDKTGMDLGALKVIVKITVIAYIVEFAAGAVRDMGESGLADKVVLAGKVAVLTMSFPIIRNLFVVITQLVGG